MSTILDRLRSAGVEVNLDGEDLSIRAKEISEEQREFLVRHKEQIKKELLARRCELSERAKARLRFAVNKLVADCEDWYRDDADILETISDAALETMILEFVARKEWYERQRMRTE
jgi:hypothetical protein